MEPVSMTLQRVQESHIPSPASGSYPVRQGNLVRPLIDAEATFSRICEAVEQARKSVWVIAAFLSPEFRMPGGRGTIFDVLDHAASCGIDVRMLIWRPEPAMYGLGKVFPGSAENRAFLDARGSQCMVRWDRAHPGFAQHQKSWLIDAGEATETAFVGGINLTASIPHIPGHPGDGQVHDVYVELTGSSATDIHHNFVQRWNEASERTAPDGVWPPRCITAQLPFPSDPSAAKGTSRVQIQRTIHAGQYQNRLPASDAQPHRIEMGERTILDQYLAAIDAARSSIYIENQAIPIPLVTSRLQRALERGVAVALLVPGVPEEAVRAARRDAEHLELFESIEALGRHERFLLAGIDGRRPDGGRSDVYVHSKVMIVDDEWSTIGSCNLHRHSLFGNVEMNVSIWDPEVARTFRVALFAEHLAIDTSAMDDRAAMLTFQRVARDNQRRREAGVTDWQGIAFGLEPATYGR